ncbi:Nascent polypeptide-associated complex subunit beta [Candidozyma auris]
MVNPKKVGGARVKAKKVVKEVDDVKLVEALGKLKATKVEGVEEANFFKDNGKSNTFAFTGYPQEKDITQLIPGILPQLGSENLEALRQLAAQLQAGKAPEELNAGAGAQGADEDIPDLVQGEKFDDVE